MGRVIAFSELDSYIRNLPHTHFMRGAVLDTNILISLTYEIKSDYEDIVKFVDGIISQGFLLFTTVNTRAEFLDFHRRLFMTEHLRDMVEKTSEWKIPTSARAQIQVQSGQLKRSEQQGSDPVFSDRQLKKIKGAFSAGDHSGHRGWIELCDGVLAGKLDEAENALERNGVRYISQHDTHQKDLFISKIGWPGAKRIAEVTCIGLADAMILNAFQCSRFPFIISADFDIGYAVLASDELKDAVMPPSGSATGGHLGRRKKLVGN